MDKGRELVKNSIGKYTRKIEKHSGIANKNDIIGIGIFDKPKSKTNKLKKGVYSNNA